VKTLISLPLTVFLLFGLLLLVPGCKTDYPGQEPEVTDPDAPIPVRVMEITPSSTPIPIEVGGTIGAKEEARLSFKIGGIINRINADEGDYVRRGATLATLKTTEIDAQVRKAERAVDKYRRDLDRTRTLYAEQAATLENVQDLETALSVAESDLEIARFNQQYARITAPVSGRIVKRFAERGELISPGNPVFLLIGEGQRSYVLRVGVADRNVLHLVEGDRSVVSLDAYPDEPIAANVTEIAAAADPRTGTFEVELTLDGQGKTLRNGFIGRAIIFPSRQPEHYRLPLDALVEGNGQKVRIFYPDENGLAVSREVRVTSLLDKSFVVPTGELTGITKIITTGAAYLQEGSALDTSTIATNTDTQQAAIQ
jgi:multidrug efflux system membrane fusion protein